MSSRNDLLNALIETATNTLIKGCENTIIPESVEIIGDEAFLLVAILFSKYAFYSRGGYEYRL